MRVHYCFGDFYGEWSFKQHFQLTLATQIYSIIPTEYEKIRK